MRSFDLTMFFGKVSCHCHLFLLLGPLATTYGLVVPQSGSQPFRPVVEATNAHVKFIYLLFYVLPNHDLWEEV